MSYLGNKPAGLPLGADDILDNSITNAKVADGVVNLATADVTGTLPLAKGGTGSANATDARTALGLGTIATLAAPAGNVVGTSDTQILTNKTITEIVFAVTGTTPALDAINGAVQTWTLTAASTPTSTMTSGQSIILVITPGAFTITWPSVVWTKQGGSGVAPTLFGAGKTTVILWMVGATLYGSHLGDTV